MRYWEILISWRLIEVSVVLETICLLFAVKLNYPDRITLSIGENNPAIAITFSNISITYVKLGDN